MDVHGAVEQAARESYGRLLAFLSTRTHDVAACEDALADAFQAALETWGATGIPERPEAWLLTTARRRLIDAARHADIHDREMPKLIVAAREAEHVTTTDAGLPDERLKMLFLCAHPAIDASIRTPLMLQTVLGLDAARIASAFLIKPAAMGQRLSRAKTKIRDAGIAFEMPDAEHLPPRLEAVLEAIYAVYGHGWDDIAGADGCGQDLTAEAIDLGRMLVRFMPGEAEAGGLLALMLHCEARRDARRTASGAYVPLSEQEVGRWSAPMIADAEQLLARASTQGPIGRFQLEAAIQSVHAHRAVTGRIGWDEIALLYEGLVRIAPTVGALVGRAAAVAESLGPAAGWNHLAHIPRPDITDYQPYWALAAHLLRQLGRQDDARDAYGRAIGMCMDQAMRTYLQQRRVELATPRPDAPH